MLKLYNSLTKQKEEFKSIKKNEVSIYVCGITPYDTTHLGHAFTYVWFDVLIRYLSFKGYKVNYLQNITDIDDDILKKAKEVNKNWQDLGNFWINQFLLDMKNLNVLPPTFYIKATDAITLMIYIIKVLIKKGYAYEVSGNVYYDVSKFKNYGYLSKFNTEEMLILSKKRGADPSDPLKKNPLDFILWQKSKPHEPFWKSPWDPPAGGGRPGWHIECSSLINKYLGDRIDIHGGGKDLIFPHHESEIAQSEIYIGKNPFVNFWMHAEMLFYKGEKMSKSLGNIIMVKDLLKKTSPNTIRFILLSHHYRKPWEFKEADTKIAEEKLSNMKFGNNNSNGFFESFMDDDLNVPGILNSNPSKETLSLLGFSL